MSNINKSKKKLAKEKVTKKRPTNIIIVFPKKTDDEVKESLICPISLQCMLVPCITRCNHIFDFININQWVTKYHNCPVCGGAINDTMNLDPDHELFKTLQKIKIKYKRKTYTYKEFIETEHNFTDEFVIKSP